MGSGIPACDALAGWGRCGAFLNVFDLHIDTAVFPFSLMLSAGCRADACLDVASPLASTTNKFGRLMPPEFIEAIAESLLEFVDVSGTQEG